MIFRQLANSTVVWSWIQNGLRVASGVLILPLVFRELSKPDLGMYYVLLGLAALAPIIDFGFGPTIDRFISYAMGGAETLEARGIPKSVRGVGPNYILLWQLLIATRKLYRYLTVVLLILLGIGGTIQVEYLIHVRSSIEPLFSPLMTRLAWAATLISTVWDIYSNWWCIYLRGLNQVRTAAQIGAAAAAIKCILAVVFLLSGAGLLSLPIAVLAGNLIQRRFARIQCLKFLPPQPLMAEVDLKKTFHVLWPNSWRLGVQLMSGSLVTQANTFICANVFLLDATGSYGASIQLMGVASSMAYVWTVTKWPVISQYQARQEYALIQRVLWPRVWLQTVTFLMLSCVVIFGAPVALHWIGKDKELLPFPWMLCLMLTNLLELLLTTSGSLIATENRIPYLWPAVISNVFSLILSMILVRFTSLGVGALVLGPLLTGCAFNYWYWPPVAARGMKTTLFRFLFFGPSKAAARI